ncbi:MAG: aminopeptidase [Candidatus Longimicrobiales bacterium M2_2A_002]
MTWTKRRTFALLGVAALAGAAMFCSPGYVIRAGYEEAKILAGRQPIPEVIAAAETDSLTRAKLELVTNVRTYAIRQLGLDVGDSYTMYTEVESDTLLLVVTASEKTAFVPYTWWFPIVGRVPYKGFFDHGDALAQARELDRKGYDTHVRPSAAFSTLGWFNDPLLSTVIDRNDVSLAATVIHEATHNTLFIPGQVAFNESLASFVGDVGAAEYFCGIEGGDGDRCRYARARWQDRIVFGEAIHRLISALENVYGAEELSRAEKLAARDTVIDRWRKGYEREVVPRLRVLYRRYHESELNNATLIGLRLYARDLDLFDRVWRESDAPLDATIRRILDAAESSPDAPFEALRRLAES